MRFERSLVCTAAVAAVVAAAPAHAAMVDIATLPGYGVESKTFASLAAGDWARVVVPAGKVVLGASIVSSGDSFQDFAVFTPAGPGQMFPAFTFGAAEYGWTLRASRANASVTVDVYFSDPQPNYTISKSIDMTFGPLGFGGWGAPQGHSVTGGGYFFTEADSWAMSSSWTENSPWWSLWQTGPREGWFIQARADKTWSPANLYVVSFDADSSGSVPAPGTAALLGLALVGLAASRRLRAPASPTP